MRSASQVISRLLMILDHVPGTWRLFSKISPARPSKQPQDRLPPTPMSVVGVIVNPTPHTNQAVGMLAGDEPGLKLALPISLDVLSQLCSLACRCSLHDSILLVLLPQSRECACMALKLVAWYVRRTRQTHRVVGASLERERSTTKRFW